MRGAEAALPERSTTVTSRTIAGVPGITSIAFTSRGAASAVGAIGSTNSCVASMALAGI